MATNEPAAPDPIAEPTSEAELKFNVVDINDWYSARTGGSEPRPDAPSGEDSATGAEDGAPDRGRKSPAPAGKVKASFNLLPEDISSLRSMAAELRSTVTYIIQRAIRDEKFIQEELAKGNRFAIVDRRGTAREIIWR